jgi:hypothetical protein
VAASGGFRELCAPHAEGELSPVPGVDDSRWGEIRAQVQSNAFGKFHNGRWTLSLFQHISVCNHR